MEDKFSCVLLGFFGVRRLLRQLLMVRRLAAGLEIGSPEWKHGSHYPFRPRDSCRNAKFGSWTAGRTYLAPSCAGSAAAKAASPFTSPFQPIPTRLQSVSRPFSTSFSPVGSMVRVYGRSRRVATNQGALMLLRDVVVLRWCSTPSSSNSYSLTPKASRVGVVMVPVTLMP